jgi:hypothetical protein
MSEREKERVKSEEDKKESEIKIKNNDPSSSSNSITSGWLPKSSADWESAWDLIWGTHGGSAYSLPQ